MGLRQQRRIGRRANFGALSANWCRHSEPRSPGHRDWAWRTASSANARGRQLLPRSPSQTDITGSLRFARFPRSLPQLSFGLHEPRNAARQAVGRREEQTCTEVLIRDRTRPRWSRDRCSVGAPRSDDKSSKTFRPKKGKQSLITTWVVGGADDPGCGRRTTRYPVCLHGVFRNSYCASIPTSSFHRPCIDDRGCNLHGAAAKTNRTRFFRRRTVTAAEQIDAPKTLRLWCIVVKYCASTIVPTMDSLRRLGSSNCHAPNTRIAGVPPDRRTNSFMTSSSPKDRGVAEPPVPG
jgi:hypothetical protein